MAAELSVDDGSITTDDGTISDIVASIDVDLTYDGAENQPGETTVSLQVSDEDFDDYTEIASSTQELTGLSGSATYLFEETSIIPGNDDDDDTSVPQRFLADEDGSEEDSKFKFQAVITPTGDIDGDGDTPDEITEQTDSKTTLVVINQVQTSSVSINGSIEAEK
jgi:hypothetical protein